MHDEDQDDPRQALRGKLQTMIADHIAEAVSARRSSGIEELWMEDEDQYEGIDAASLATSQTTKEHYRRKTAPSTARSRVFLNITKPKTDIWVSRVVGMLLPHDDRPWEIKPTPVPDIDEAIESESDEQVMLADGTPAKVTDVAAAAKEAARIASEKMSRHIEDWLVECDAYAEMRKVIRDAGRAGTGVLKGPVPVMRENRKWRTENGATVMQVIERVAPASIRKDYWDVFPDPSCGTNIQDGAYFAERDHWTPKVLRQWAKTPGVDRKAVAEILKEGPGKVAREDDRSGRQKDGEARIIDTTRFEVFHYYGELSPADLVVAGWAKSSALGVGAPDDSDEQEGEQDPEQAADTDDGLIDLAESEIALMAIPVVATVINDRVVRMVLSPNETGEFPFDFMVGEEVEGQPWGRGIPRKMAAPQRVLNAGVRALLENAGMSAGPQIIVAEGHVEPVDKDPTITGRKLWKFTPSDEIDDARKAMAVFDIPSVQVELQAIIDYSMRMADELTNLPLMLQGIVGDAPDTLGGLKMLQGNAASPLKQVAKLFDDRVVVPHLRRYYAWGMADPDVPEDAKGDLRCMARGSTALVQREDGAQFLAGSYQLVKDQDMRINPAKWFGELCKAHGMSAESIQFTADEWKQIQEQRAQQPPPVAPAVEAAKIRAEAAVAVAQSRDQLMAEKIAADTDRDTAYNESMARRDAATYAARMSELEIRRELAMLDYANTRELSLEQVKADLAQTVMKLRTQKELAASNGEGPQVATPPTEPPQHAPDGRAYAE